jgi:alkylation response protein AidB-like acyl-CoA dehydrogenase
MEFGLSEDQVLLQETVRRLVADRIPLDLIRQVAQDDAAATAGLAEEIGALALDGILVPETEGGAGLGVLDAVLVQECFGYGVVPARFLSNSVAAFALRDASGGLGAAIASGQACFSLALNERLSRRDGAGVRLADGNLTGRAMMVMDAAEATHSLLWSDQGLQVVAAPDAEALQTIDRTRIFSKLEVDHECLASLPDRTDMTFAVACVLLAADTLGAAQCMLDKAVAYASERKQFGRVIGSFQAVKHLCAEMAARLEPARALVWHAAHAIDTDDDEAIAMACLAKAHLSEVGTFVARTSTEVHGGMGFTDLVGLHYWFKRIGVNRQLLGSPMALRDLAARHQDLVA